MYWCQHCGSQNPNVHDIVCPKFGEVVRRWTQEQLSKEDQGFKEGNYARVIGREITDNPYPISSQRGYEWRVGFESPELVGEER